MQDTMDSETGKVKGDALNQAIANVLTAAAALSIDERQALFEAQVADAKAHLRAAKDALEKLDTLRYLIPGASAMADPSRWQASEHIREVLETIDDL
ncbi:hypothetical protein [Burkholderia vietnamiensis]|uniref:hypothetical protein n=1 Tax=Burkholderia vietnamiensis TaxID=60552 RepID=UPI001CF32B9D|nr:hypothetical protein [Burkholderia vietnamiensis]MCA8448916.1 hypothetical protein [Burkholderia vietnamiensis]